MNWIFSVREAVFFLGIMSLGICHAQSSPWRHIQYRFTLSNQSGDLISPVDFYVFAPMERLETDVPVIESSQPYTVVKDGQGNQLLHFCFDRIPPFGVQTVRIDAQVPVNGKFQYGGDVRDDRFLHAEPFIETDQPQLSSLAAGFACDDPSDTVEQISRWMKKNIAREGLVPRPQGALETLLTRKADCTGQSYLFVALCRANGIPSRPVYGYVCEENMVLTPEGYHQWAEFCLDGVWHAVDPVWNRAAADCRNYIALCAGSFSNNTMSDGRLYRCSDKRIKVRMDKP